MKLLLTGCALLLMFTGCTTGVLETGYKYRPLGVTSTERRAYYASPFSPEVRDAESVREDLDAIRRPARY